MDFVHYNINSKELSNILGNIVTNTGVWLWDDDYFRDTDGVMVFHPQDRSEAKRGVFCNSLGSWFRGSTIRFGILY
jgi:hypothetical protein